MTKIKLIFAQSDYDYSNAWTNIKTVDVEVPDELLERDVSEHESRWQLIGCEWEGRR